MGRGGLLIPRRQHARKHSLASNLNPKRHKRFKARTCQARCDLAETFAWMALLKIEMAMSFEGTQKAYDRVEYRSTESMSDEEKVKYRQSQLYGTSVSPSALGKLKAETS